ncbi:MAG TPA: OsmC family protein [Candidatus Sulfotelmatobacter sp.]|nr:OsmC family protein [Candidatus Sulfotelmatobacter sp.]
MTNTSTLRLETVASGLRFRAHSGKGFELVLDSGEGRIAADPMESLLAAIGACTAMDVISIMRKKRQQVTAYEVSLTGERRTEHPRSYTRIETVHRMTGTGLSLAALEESVRLSETRYCSVHASLDPAIEKVTRCEVIEAVAV